MELGACLTNDRRHEGAPHRADFCDRYATHSGYYVSETIAEICRREAAAVGASLVRQAPGACIASTFPRRSECNGDFIRIARAVAPTCEVPEYPIAPAASNPQRSNTNRAFDAKCPHETWRNRLAAPGRPEAKFGCGLRSDATCHLAQSLRTGRCFSAWACSCLGPACRAHSSAGSRRSKDFPLW